MTSSNDHTVILGGGIGPLATPPDHAAPLAIANAPPANPPDVPTDQPIPLVGATGPSGNASASPPGQAAGSNSHISSDQFVYDFFNTPTVSPNAAVVVDGATQGALQDIMSAADQLNHTLLQVSTTPHDPAVNVLDGTDWTHLHANLPYSDFDLM